MSTTPATILWWRIRPGVYESIDAEFRIERVARDSWTLWGDFYTVQVGYEGETATERFCIDTEFLTLASAKSHAQRLRDARNALAEET